MQKRFFISYILIFVTLLTMMSLSRHSTDKLRGGSVEWMAPLWEKILSLKYFFSHPFEPTPWSQISKEEEKEQLELKNQLLETEISFLQKLLDEQLLITSQVNQIPFLTTDERSSLIEHSQTSLARTLAAMHKRMEGFPARVIFRSLDTWNSFLWINVGETINVSAEKALIAVNSPVILGKSIVGLIDYVGKNQSRVRLISDSRLHPSVRAARGGEHDFLMCDQIERLLHQIKLKNALPLSDKDQNQLKELLFSLQQKLNPSKKSWYLAKGELLGSLNSARQEQRVTLKGTGFNYDFADDEGNSRDLRTGKNANHSHGEAISLLKINDILLTTGMDGIFPPGFQVAIVKKIGLLKEGDYFYELEAEPIVGSLEGLSLVFVLPPTSEERSPYHATTTQK